MLPLRGASHTQLAAAFPLPAQPVGLSPPSHAIFPSTAYRPADPEDPMRVTDATRSLGLIVCRGTSVMLVVPTAGTEEIANPFQQEMEG